MAHVIARRLGTVVSMVLVLVALGAAWLIAG
jgi:hypothetical protein